ncbi:ExbD/TolR family protein [Amaricoccus macauensis]|uniref:ExbD/TolR family protein n=1 Tax=Amaricoccus macauensis TaxID=57001 RepID=UPI003C7C1C29
MRKLRKRSKLEPTIALINVVFLMLVFFLVAGTVAPPMDKDVTLVSTAELEGREPPDAIILSGEGERRYRGEPLGDLGNYLEQLGDEPTVRIVPDREAPAAELIALGRDLREAGAARVMIVTEQALE